MNTPETNPILVRQERNVGLWLAENYPFAVEPDQLLTRYHDYQYLDTISHIREFGRQKFDRTGTGTISKFGAMMRFDIQHGIIPLLTSKKMHLPAIIHEIIWYLSGDTNIKYLQDNGVRIWNEWADKNGNLGPVYGEQWRKWPHMEFNPDHNTEAVFGFDFNDDTKCEHIFQADVRIRYIDQIAQVINDLKTNPDSRRLIVSAWNVGQLQDMKLPPCHYSFQFYSEEMTLEERIRWWRVEHNAPSMSTTNATHEGMDLMQVPRRYLSCMLNQRSADMFLGVPFNISQYSIITCLIAKLVGMATKEFIWSGGDCHIYLNHQDQVNEQLSRIPYQSPKLVINPEVTDIDQIKFSDFMVEDYVYHPTIKAAVAV